MAFSVSAIVSSASDKDTVNYIPQIHGTLRGRYEVATESGDYHFQLRNARVSLNGFIAPFIDYFLQADLCDKGTMKFLDGWLRLKIINGLSVQAGQFRMPFGIDTFRSPHNYYFANRSFIGKQVCNYRAVGGKVTYALPVAPLVLEAGAFNPGTISDHKPWNNTLAYATKATYTLHNVKLTAGFQSIIPDSVRINLIDGCISWNSGQWLVEGEYMYKHYTSSSHIPAHAYNLFANYHMPVKAWIFNKLSFQARFDGMTAHSSGIRNPQGLLDTDHPARNRITVGATISYVKTKSMFLDIRANYEKYLYHDGVKALPDSGDKAVVEFVARF